MIRVAVKVRSGDARFQVVVQAENIERAVHLAKTRYPGGKVQVLFPIEPDAFFAKEATPDWVVIWSETQNRLPDKSQPGGPRGATQLVYGCESC